jgi:hypothetical protein
MSGIGSASGAAAAAAGGSASLAVLVEVELQILATEGAALRALLGVGDVVRAQVLPPNGLSDLLSIAGFRVAATLPPNLVPGDVITVTVTSTANGQVAVQIVPPETPLTNTTPPLADDAGADPAATTPSTPSSGSAGGSGGSAAAPPPQSQPQAAPLPARAALAPPPAVFAAAAVRAAGVAAAIPSIVVSAGPPAAAAPSASTSGSIEARIGAARANGQRRIGTAVRSAADRDPEYHRASGARTRRLRSGAADRPRTPRSRRRRARCSRGPPARRSSRGP